MDKDLLNRVRDRLNNDVGRLRQVAEETEIPYDTILRIKNGEGDPGYSKVQTLAEHYELVPRPNAQRKPEVRGPDRRHAAESISGGAAKTIKARMA